MVSLDIRGRVGKIDVRISERVIHVKKRKSRACSYNRKTNEYWMSDNKISVWTLDLNSKFPIIVAQLNSMA